MQNQFNPKISVIIPVYNCEKYLEKCLNSLIFQIYENLEIICIDDGSTDNSLSVLEDFAKKDSRIKVYSQENKGQSSTRNRGLELATGDFISFVDADDWLYLTLYQTFVDTINKTNRHNLDIWMFNISSYFKGENDVVRRLFINIYDWKNHKDEYSIHTFADCRAPFINNISACNKIFRTDFLKDIDLKFPENLKYEDQYFSSKAMLNARAMLINEETFYRYRNVESGSQMTTKTPKVFDIFTIAEMVSDEVKRLHLYEIHKYALFQYKYQTYVNSFRVCPEELKEEYYNKMKKLLLDIEKDLNPAIAPRLRNYNIFQFVKQSNFKQFNDNFV